MSADQKIDFDGLVQDAMRGIVRTILQRVVDEDGLPGQHHFYIAFNTQAPGVQISPRLRKKYSEEMTIVMQHRFWDLKVRRDRFEIKLTFDSIPERLVVPFSAVKVFFDPSVPYGLQFEESELGSDASRQALGMGNGQGVVEPLSIVADASGEQSRSLRPGGQNDTGKATVKRRKAAAIGSADNADRSDSAKAGDEPAIATPAKAPRKKPAIVPAAAKLEAPANKPVEAQEHAEHSEHADGAKVVRLDAFRKK